VCRQIADISEEQCLQTALTIYQLTQHIPEDLNLLSTTLRT